MISLHWPPGLDKTPCQSYRELNKVTNFSNGKILYSRRDQSSKTSKKTTSSTSAKVCDEYNDIVFDEYNNKPEKYSIIDQKKKTFVSERIQDEKLSNTAWNWKV